MAEAYVNYTDVDEYASSRLRSEAWTNANLADRGKAIIMAMRVIENLRFAGLKTDPDQGRQFPRGGDTEIPEAIKNACSEIAIALLGGADVEKDFGQQRVTSRRFASVATTYDQGIVSENVAAGIPSIVAWRYLKPYLADPNSVQLNRVD